MKNTRDDNNNIRNNPGKSKDFLYRDALEKKNLLTEAIFFPSKHIEARKVEHPSHRMRNFSSFHRFREAFPRP